MNTIEMTEKLRFFLIVFKAALLKLGCDEQAHMIEEFVEDSFTDEQFEAIEQMSKLEIAQHALDHADDTWDTFNT